MAGGSVRVGADVGSAAPPQATRAAEPISRTASQVTFAVIDPIILLAIGRSSRDGSSACMVSHQGEFDKEQTATYAGTAVDDY